MPRDGTSRTRARDVTGGWLRLAVFCYGRAGVELRARAGAAGGGVDQSVIILAGLAGLAAGAPAWLPVGRHAGSWPGEISPSARSARTRTPRRARRHVRRQGLEPELAKEVARQLHLDPTALSMSILVKARRHARRLPSLRLAAASSFAASPGPRAGDAAFLGAQTLWPAVVVSCCCSSPARPSPA
jgi:hypothetical protein